MSLHDAVSGAELDRHLQSVGRGAPLGIARRGPRLRLHRGATGRLGLRRRALSERSPDRLPAPRLAPRPRRRCPSRSAPTATRSARRTGPDGVTGELVYVGPGCPTDYAGTTSAARSSSATGWRCRARRARQASPARSARSTSTTSTSTRCASRRSGARRSRRPPAPARRPRRRRHPRGWRAPEGASGDRSGRRAAGRPSRTGPGRRSRP